MIEKDQHWGKHCALGHGAKNPIVNGIGNLETFESYRVWVVIFPSEKALKPSLGRREHEHHARHRHSSSINISIGSNLICRKKARSAGYS